MNLQADASSPGASAHASPAKDDQIGDYGVETRFGVGTPHVPDASTSVKGKKRRRRLGGHEAVDRRGSADAD